MGDIKVIGLPNVFLYNENAIRAMQDVLDLPPSHLKTLDDMLRYVSTYPDSILKAMDNHSSAIFMSEGLSKTILAHGGYKVKAAKYDTDINNIEDVFVILARFPDSIQRVHTTKEHKGVAVSESVYASWQDLYQRGVGSRELIKAALYPTSRTKELNLS